MIALRIGWAILGLITAIAPLGARSAPPTWLQDRANEQLIVEIVSVKTGYKDSALAVQAQAKVIDVTKSVAGLKAGRLIEIRYSTFRQEPIGSKTSKTVNTSCGGGSPQLPKLMEKTKYRVYLTKSSGAYSPAASYISFVKQ